MATCSACIVTSSACITLDNIVIGLAAHNLPPYSLGYVHLPGVYRDPDNSLYRFRGAAFQPSFSTEPVRPICICDCGYCRLYARVQISILAKTQGNGHTKEYSLRRIHPGDDPSFRLSPGLRSGMSSKSGDSSPRKGRVLLMKNHRD